MLIRLVDLALWGFGILPEPVARGLGKCVGFLARRVFRFRVDIVRGQLAKALPELTATRRQEIEKAFYRHLGLTAIEILRLRSLSDEQVVARTRFSNFEDFDNVFKQGRGAFLLTAHLGNWEYASSAFGARGFTAHMVVKEIKGKAGQHLAVSMREKHQVRLIGRRNSIREIFKVIRAGNGVGFVLDQNMTRDEGVFVDFFGMPACTMPGLAIMAKRLQAPVIPLCCHRDENNIHQLEFLPPVEWEEPAGLSPDEIIRHNTQRYTTVLEQMIRKHPEQWLWIHKRWRTQPPAETSAFQEA